MWSPELRVLLRTILPAPRTVLTSHLWRPPARLSHPALHLPVQPVRASCCSTGQAVHPRLSSLECPRAPQAWPPCSTFSIRRRVFLHLQRPTDPLETRHRHITPPLTETQRKRTTFLIPPPHRTAPTSLSPSLTSLPATKRKSSPTASPPPTRRMLHLYVHTTLHCLYTCLFIPCGWVSLRTYIIIRVSWLMSGCAESYFGSIALCSYMCFSCISSGNEFKQRFRARAESHILNRSR